MATILMTILLKTVLVLSGWTCLASDRIERDGAIVVCDETEHDFGIVWAGEQLCYTFVLKNEGSETAYLRAWPAVAGTTNKTSIVLGPYSEVPLSDCLNSRKLNGPFEKSWTVKLLPPSATGDSVPAVREAADASGTPNPWNNRIREGLINIPSRARFAATALWPWWNALVQARPLVQPAGANVTVETRGATIICEQPEHDFGVVWTGDVLCHTFVLKNIGKQSTRIAVIYPGVGTSANYHSIDAGAAYDLKLCLNSTRLNGPFEKMITVVERP